MVNARALKTQIDNRKHEKSDGTRTRDTTKGAAPPGLGTRPRLSPLTLATAARTPPRLRALLPPSSRGSVAAASAGAAAPWACSVGVAARAA
eukprot:7070640-Prymnesium_polylepis.1